MPQARGSDFSVVGYDEDTYGQDPGTPSGVLLYVTKSGVKSKQNRKDSNTLTSSRGKAKPVAGNIDVGGGLPMEIAPESIGFPLRHTMGALATSGVGPYTHTLTVGDLPIGFTLEHDYGAAISGVGRYEKFNGCRVASARFNCPQEGYPEVTFEIKGANSVLASAPLDATPTDNGHTGFSAFEASILEGGASIATVTSAEIQISNDLDESAYVVGGAGKRAALPEGQAMISGKIRAMFDSAALLTKAIDGTESSLKVTLSRGDGLGSAGNESLELLVQQLVYERNGPDVSGPKGVFVDLTFKGFKSGADLGLQLTLKNALATI